MLPFSTIAHACGMPVHEQQKRTEMRSQNTYPCLQPHSLQPSSLCASHLLRVHSHGGVEAHAWLLLASRATPLAATWAPAMLLPGCLLLHLLWHTLWRHHDWHGCRRIWL